MHFDFKALKKIALSGLLCVGAAKPAFAQDKLLGDIVSGSKSNAVHVIELFDENGDKITPADKNPMPISTRQTCGKCHDYNEIAKGWHFNMALKQPGRPGEPWILADVRTGTQLPLSFNEWPGVFNPEKTGMSTWQMTKRFGFMMPGTAAEPNNPDEIIRSYVSGQLEINCFACHSADNAYDHSEYATQVLRENFRWAPTAATGLAIVSGKAKDMPNTWAPQVSMVFDDRGMEPPAVSYKTQAFDSKNRVFFDLKKTPDASRCYSCHSSSHSAQSPRNPDVHIASGMTCADCHAEQLDHATVRGYEGEKSSNSHASASTCKACHIDQTNSAAPIAGRFAAPKPAHAGIPLVHFEKLTCTACHSGPWPGKQTGTSRTSLAHRLGTKFMVPEGMMPNIIEPVFALDSAGKIGPFRMIWPSYWAAIENGRPAPVTSDDVFARAGSIIYGPNEPITIKPNLSEPKVAQVLAHLSKDGRQYAYFCGGKEYKLDSAGKLVSADSQNAKPYLWSFAHDVRPAAQSLGVRGCGDCHSTDSGFMFAKVQVDSPLSAQTIFTDASVFSRLDPVYEKAFSLSFVFRPWLKVTTILSSILLFALVTMQGFKSLSNLARALSERQD